MEFSFAFIFADSRVHVSVVAELNDHEREPRGH
jgi:hypothetical protein